VVFGYVQARMFWRRTLGLVCLLTVVACSTESAPSSDPTQDAAAAFHRDAAVGPDAQGRPTGADASSDIEAGANVDAAAPLDFGRLTPACFQVQPEPVLTRDSLFEGSDWNDPSVLVMGDELVMYASSDHAFDLDIAIYRLVSLDGVAWQLDPGTPVLEADASAGAWDQRAVETPSVVWFRGQYHMFYTGYPVTHDEPKSYRIGHAVSADGLTWERVGVVLSPNAPSDDTPNLTFDQWITAEPASVVWNDTLHLYFSALGASTKVGTTWQVIGLVTSTDGVSWSEPKAVLEPDLAQSPRADWIGYSTPAALVLGDALHLFFDVVHDAPWQQRELRHAVSADGESGFRVDAQPLLDVSRLSWASREVRAPAPWLDGSTLRVWFGGDDGTTLGIGRMDCALR